MIQHELEDCSELDEFGWDPMVDDYLESLVEEADHTEEGKVDWGLISLQFLDTLDPTQDQMEAALERFSPESLRERWWYLRSRLAMPHQKATSSVAQEPARDRVLEAMQNFLFGLPKPRMNPESRETALEPGAEAEQAFAVPTGPGEAAPPHASDAEDIYAKQSIKEPAGAGEHSAYGTDAALRRCLEELRWHGEALCQCAAGANAQELCAEASARRKELFWSLGCEHKKDRAP
ncbi:unnamed protein product [Durusdinium trenchii]|uniref:Uncharacterized protein n=1 Tax=Durusdinium trenchii TaxID=1381693 RepID=A0ABP0SLE2_9DINO